MWLTLTKQHMNNNMTPSKIFHISRKHNADPDLDAVVGETNKSPLLDNSAQKHKLSVKPKKRHASSVQKKFCPKPGER